MKGLDDFDKYDIENTLVDDETWAIILEAALRDRPGVAEAMGRLLFYVKEAIELGPEGLARAVNTLMEGIHMVYPYTTAFGLSRRLWILSLEGDLTPVNEPDALIKTAIEKGWEETVTGRRRRAARRVKATKSCGLRE
jgi:hypothetical protein